MERWYLCAYVGLGAYTESLEAEYSALHMQKRCGALSEAHSWGGRMHWVHSEIFALVIEVSIFTLTALAVSSQPQTLTLYVNWNILVLPSLLLYSPLWFLLFQVYVRTGGCGFSLLSTQRLLGSTDNLLLETCQSFLYTSWESISIFSAVYPAKR